MKHFAALLLAALICAMALAGAPGPEQDDAPGIVPRYLLADPNGRSVTSEDFRGKFQLITFGYTYCPDVCPTTLVDVAAVIQRLGPAADRLQALFITVDPERDSGKVLRTYTEFFSPHILGLGGSPALVRRAAENFKVRYAKVREPGASAERYSVDHGAGLFLLGPDGALIKKFAYGTPPAEMAAVLESLIRD